MAAAGTKSIALATAGQWSRTALEIPENTTLEGWLEVGERLQAMEQSVMWWIGDWLRFGERRYGDTYDQAVVKTGYTEQTLMDAKWVADRYQISERSENLSWSHHRAAAKLPALERREMLEQAVLNGWSTRELKNALTRVAVGLPAEPEAAQPEGPTPFTADRIVKQTTRTMLAAFCDWFGIGEDYGRVLMVLYQTGGQALDWRQISRAVNSHHPMARGAVHEAISTLRSTFEAEGIDRDDSGYWLSEVGFAECRHAFREMSRTLAAMGVEPANDLSPLRTPAEAAD